MNKQYIAPTATLTVCTASTTLLAGSPDITDKGQGGSDPNTAKGNNFSDFEDDENESDGAAFTASCLPAPGKSVWD